MGEDDEKFVGIGDQNLELLINVGFANDSTIVDIGSGYGRLAYAIARRFPNFEGSYYGFDILNRHVSWCQDEFHNHTGFKFIYQDIKNDRYNTTGKLAASDYSFPIEDKSINHVALFSVFTHLYENEIHRYLSEIDRMLVSGGTCVATFFLFNEENLDLINNRSSGFTLKHALNDHTRYYDDKHPLHVISYHEDFIRSLLQKFDLKLLSINWGNWSGSDSKHFQDIVIFKKNGVDETI